VIHQTLVGWHGVKLVLNRQQTTKIVKLRRWCIARTFSVYGQWNESHGLSYDSGEKIWTVEFFFKDQDVAIEFKLVYEAVLSDDWLE
jgi:hypothetical protein